MSLHPDFKDLLSAFADAEVKYLLIGGYAVGFHSRPRFTKDIDVWIAEDGDNVRRVHAALARFGAPAVVLEDLTNLGPDEILYFGSPPFRVDILKRISGVEFEDAFANRVETEWDGVPVMLIGIDELIEAKRAAGREQDLIDVRELERSRDEGD
jgi:hypothetical protein